MNRPINEDDVKRMLRRYKRNWRYGSELSVGHVCLLAIEDVEAMPTLDVTPTVHAKYGFIGPRVGCFVGDFLYGSCSACHERVLYTHKHNSFCPNCGAKMDLNSLGHQKPMRYMMPCPNCGGNQIAITGNDVANDGELGVILQERTCESCGKKHHAKLLYRLQGVSPISEEELPRG